MALPSYIESIKWRPVAGLILAGLMGWLLAWLILPQATMDPLRPNSGASQGLPVPPLQVTTPPSAPLLPGTTSRSAEISPHRPGFEELLKQQSKVSESAADTVAKIPAPAASVFATLPSVAASRQAASKQGPNKTEDSVRQAKLKALTDLRTNAILELQSVPPNDTKRMMAIVEKFDAQLRAAGAPAVLDLENLRKTLESANRLNELSQQMQTEVDKGKAADVGRLQAMSQEMQAIQKAIPRQVYRPDVLRQVLSQ